MVEAGNGSYRLPDGMPQIPLMFSLTATKPEDGPAGAAAAEVAPPDGAGLP